MNSDSSSPFSYVGGHSLVDLVNTEILVKGIPYDLIKDLEEARLWAIGANLIPPDTELYESCNGERWLRQLKTFRRKMRLMLEEICTGGRASTSSLAVINEHLKKRKKQEVLRECEQSYQLEAEYPFTAKACLIHVLAEAAADFLVQLDHRDLKHCESERCVRYFLDTTKNRSRRWCSMESCGNRIKAKRHYHNRRKTQS